MIDWDRLNELRSEIGDGDFAEVVELFLLEADEVIARISVSAGATALEADLHFLK
jgi:histidine phosphotransfer protein HptB